MTTPPRVVRGLNTHYLKLPHDLGCQRIFGRVPIQLPIIYQRVVTELEDVLERGMTVFVGAREMIGNPIAVANRLHQVLDL